MELPVALADIELTFIGTDFPLNAPFIIYGVICLL